MHDNDKKDVVETVDIFVVIFTAFSCVYSFNGMGIE